MIHALVLFLIAGIAEIGGGYLIWLWLREGKPFFWGMAGGIALALYGVIATFQSFPAFGRVYAAYGGVFIVLSILWGWGIDKKHRISMTGSVRVSASWVFQLCCLHHGNRDRFIVPYSDSFAGNDALSIIPRDQ